MWRRFAICVRSELSHRRQHFQKNIGFQPPPKTLNPFLKVPAFRCIAVFISMCQLVAANVRRLTSGITCITALFRAVCRPAYFHSPDLRCCRRIIPASALSDLFTALAFGKALATSGSRTTTYLELRQEENNAAHEIEVNSSNFRR
jgi:hypothetical protein